MNTEYGGLNRSEVTQLLLISFG